MLAESSTPRCPASPYPSYNCSQPPTHHHSTAIYPSPAKSEADQSAYMSIDAFGLSYYHHQQASVPNPQSLYPLSPNPSETTWTPTGQMMEDHPGAWQEDYQPLERLTVTWERQHYHPYPQGIPDHRQSSIYSDSRLISQRSSVSSTYDPSLYSQDDSESAFNCMVKLEPQTEWQSGDDEPNYSYGPQAITVSPDRLASSGYQISQGGQSTTQCKTPLEELPQMEPRVKEMSVESDTCFKTDITRTRTRKATTRANAKDMCDECGMLFSRHYNQKAHMETHDPNRQKNNVCEWRGCSRKFSRRTDRERHESCVHLKLKDWKCAACGNVFGRKDTLRRHAEDGCAKRKEVKQGGRGKSCPALRQRRN